MFFVRRKKSGWTVVEIDDDHLTLKAKRAGFKVREDAHFCMLVEKYGWPKQIALYAAAHELGSDYTHVHHLKKRRQELRTA